MPGSKQKLNEAEPTNIKKIEVGKFYQLFDGSKSGHPGYIIWKNDQHNLYLAIKFGTSSNKNNKEINFAIRKGDKENLVYNKPFLGKRKNIGRNELTEMNIESELLANIIESLDFLNPSYSPDIRRHDKRFYKWAIKNPLYQGQLSDTKGPADVNNIQNKEVDVNKNS